MNKDKKWMLMTYYCPTHGDLGRTEPIEIMNNEMNKTFLKGNSQKEINELN